ncbi:tetratricopeptide TPR_4 [Novosphingobium nitrogenifigens DSM 19370]|uniref:Tetratricopeptide TPR_4 n=1 Tax=Novosphingobium nitrogenifigens DSM 19370 TaxID=983920 RepID=F1Z6S3_9SPHN|nr:hypothetical protein [Novosphingobium nitrogenifigens]EGD59733.1 tetratricopeptide TPR_4 [Novosphingobium nitrogenifigens DSM 19370]
MIAILPLFALLQIGPSPHNFDPSPLPIPGHEHHEAQLAEKPQKTPPVVDPLAECLGKARMDSASGLAYARKWLSEARVPSARVRPDQCLGMVLSDQGDFNAAEGAFADGVSAIPVMQEASAVPLMAMAGNAALAAGGSARALAWFDRALAVKAYDDYAQRGAIYADRARALVALGRLDEAGASLTQARRLAPEYAGAFLLSATLARRQKDLVSAQEFIESASRINPHDPAIGLEAGVIAVLAGHDEAARKSWSSVVSTSPDSPEAETARGYLSQLGPVPGGSGPGGGGQPLDRTATSPTSGAVSPPEH